MNERTYAKHNDLDSLTEDARGLMATTADVAGGKVADARKRLTAALEGGKELYSLAKDKTVEVMKVTDNAVREHPYQAISIGIGVGALIGFLAGRRYSRTGT